MQPRIFFLQVSQKLLVTRGTRAILEPPVWKGGSEDTARNHSKGKPELKGGGKYRLGGLVGMEADDELD